MNVFSYKFNLNDENKLKAFLSDYDVVFEPQQYCVFAAKCSKFKALFYQSGKFVIQGSCVDDIVQALVDEFKIRNVSLNCNPVSNNEKNTRQNNNFKS